MAQIEVFMPKMGESIIEATIIKWSKQVGEKIELEETLLEIATDKVDSEIPSPVQGTLAKVFFEEEAVVKVGAVIALIATEGETLVSPSPAAVEVEVPQAETSPSSKQQPATASINSDIEKIARPSVSKRFYSPLVRSIAKKENISMEALEQIDGSGKDDRVTKADILQYIENRENGSSMPSSTTSKPVSAPVANTSQSSVAPKIAASVNGEVEIIEMDRTRRLIAAHMTRSKQVSAHVTSFVEIDVTNLVNWRNKIKASFQEKHNEKITFTPVFVEAVVKAIQDFPLVNISVEDTNIIVKKAINIGMATALPSGNLIVPVIKNAANLNLVGLTKQVNGLARKARANQLSPDDIQGGTFTITNVGTFGNVMGTPIINQPQVAILSTGIIKKKPAVLETEFGDVIAVRQMMFLSLSYDHRVVDGMLGGSFLRRIGDYLEQFDGERAI